LPWPELVRIDGPVRIWQYRSSGCVLDIFFTDKSQQPAHYEIRARKTDVPDEAVQSSCVRTIARRNTAI